jgi:hypothetical protein
VMVIRALSFMGATGQMGTQGGLGTPKAKHPSIIHTVQRSNISS